MRCSRRSSRSNNPARSGTDDERARDGRRPTVLGSPRRAATHDLRDPADIEHLVRAFYRRAATDNLLGPVFEAAHVDWSNHIPKLVAFWSWQLLGIRGYEGNPLRAHAPLQAATPFREEHYARWLELFTETVDERFLGPLAETAKCRARKMAKALQRLLGGESAAGDIPVKSNPSGCTATDISLVASLDSSTSTFPSPITFAPTPTTRQRRRSRARDAGRGFSPSALRLPWPARRGRPGSCRARRSRRS